MSEDETATAGDPGQPESDPQAGDETEGDRPSRDLAGRVAEHDEELGDSVAELEAEVVALRSERADLQEQVEELESTLEERTERLQRTQADFQNFKKRAERRRAELEETATEDLVERLLDVRDNLSRALDAEGEIRDGVEATLRVLDDVLADEGVERVDPDPGDALDPHRHEVMLRVDSEVPAGTVAEVYRPGYRMGERVVRPAQVTVSEADESSTETTGAEDG